MPLVERFGVAPEGVVGVWKITEPESFFIERLPLSPNETAKLEPLSGRRRIEWLAVRYLVHFLSERDVRGEILKDEHGKPYIADSFFQISMSHSQDHVAAMAAPRSCGIDLQNFVPKIERLANKFLSPLEMDSLSTIHKLDQLHVFWSAKEVLYKAYGRRQINFAQHLYVGPFTYHPDGGTILAKVTKDQERYDYRLQYHKVNGFFLVYGVEVFTGWR